MPQQLNPKVMLALVGAALTPVATGISLQLAPFIGPLLLYAAVAFFFARRWFPLSWKVGIWLTGGLLAITGLVALALLVIKALKGGLHSEYFAGVWSFVWVTLLFSGVPALLGGCGAGWVGAALSRKRIARSPSEPPVTE